MNLNVPHTILLVNHPRVRLSLPRLSRVLGPGVYHFEGDLRPLFKSLNQVKLVKRGALELFFEGGDTTAFLTRQIDRLNTTIGELYTDGKTPEDSVLANLNARLSFLHTVASRQGIDVRAPLVSTVADPDEEELEVRPDDAATDTTPEAPVAPAAPVKRSLDAEGIDHVAAQLLGMPAEERRSSVDEIKLKFDEATYLAVIDRFNALREEAAAPAPAPAEETPSDDTPTPEVAPEPAADPAADDSGAEDESAPAAAAPEAAEDTESEPEQPAAPVDVPDTTPESEPTEDAPALVEDESEVAPEAPAPEAVLNVDPEIAAKPASTLNGIGAKTQSKLEAVGLGTLGALAVSTPEALAEIDTISEDEAVAHIAEARSRLGLTE